MADTMSTEEQTATTQNTNNKTNYEVPCSDLGEAQLADETAWDLLNTVLKPDHAMYDVGDHTKETIPIITKVLHEHGLNGLDTGDVIEIIGNEQCGKTQLLYQYLINCCLPPKITVSKATKNKRPTLLELGGHYCQAIFFDLHLSFDVDRLYHIFVTQITRKVIKHNTNVHAQIRNNQTNKNLKNASTSPRTRRHSEPNAIHELTQKDIDLAKHMKRHIEIDAKQFIASVEGQKLWKLVHSKISVVQIMSPIQLIASLHRLRAMLNDMYSLKRRHEMYSFTEQYMDKEEQEDRKDAMDIDMYEYQDEFNEHRMNYLLRKGDNGMRMVLIDDMNAFFNELTATKERDKYYNSMSCLLMDICYEFGLIVVFTRFCQFKQEREWLKKVLPLVNSKMRMKSVTNMRIKPHEMFHRKFGKIELESKALFVVFLYREGMQCFDSTVTHPAIMNDLFEGKEEEQRKKYLIGDHKVTKKWIKNVKARGNGEYMDPFRYIQSRYPAEDYNQIRGVVVTQTEFITRAMDKKKQNDKEYEQVRIEKKMIRFYGTIHQRKGFDQIIDSILRTHSQSCLGVLKVSDHRTTRE
eukprot:221026_1